jgi:hypothetical protein
MAIDPSQSTTPFAPMTDLSYYKNREDKIFFSIHTVFRIKKTVVIRLKKLNVK